MSPTDAVQSFSSAVLKAILNSQMQGSGQPLPFVQGQVIEAIVSERPLKDNPQKTEKGILLNGKFVQVDLPEDVNAGDVVKVQVVNNADQIKLKFIEKLDEAVVTKPSVQLAQQLLKLLSGVKLSEEIIKELRDLSQGSPQHNPEVVNSNPSQVAINRGTQQVLSQPLVLIDLDSHAPRLLEQALKNYDSANVLKQVQKAKQDSMQIEYKEIAPQQKLILEEVQKNLKTILSHIDQEYSIKQPLTLGKEQGLKQYAAQEVKKEISINTQEVEKTQSTRSESYKQFEIAVDKFSSENKVIATQGNPISRLLNFLASVGEKGSEILHDGEKKLFQIFNDQVNILKNIEQHVKKLLISNSNETPLTSLLRVLEQIPTRIEPEDNSIQQQFKKFISEFSDALKILNESKATPDELQQFLVLKLDQLYINFGLKPFDQRGDISSTEENLLKLAPFQINALKSIEVQIKLILNSPFQDLFEISDLTSPQGLPKLIVKSPELQALIDIIKDVKVNKPSEFKNPAQEKFYELVDKLDGDISSLIKENSEPKQAAKELRLLLEKNQHNPVLKDLINLGTLRDMQHAERQVVISTIFDNTKMPGTKEDLAQFQNIQLKNVAELMRDIINASENIFISEPTSNIVSIIARSPAYKALIEVLKRLDFSISNPQNQMEQEVLDFSGQLLQTLEKDLAKPAAMFRENLQKSFDLLHSKFLKPQELTNSDVLASLDKHNMQSLEGLLAGQEIMQQLNPIMKVAGEPVMMLFPFLLQGMISKLEVQVFPRKISDGDQDKSSQTQANMESAYEHLLVKLALPKLGKVEINIVHRRNELLLHFNFERQEACQFIEERLGLLRKVFYARGYQNFECAVECRLAAPAITWFSELVSASRTVA